MLLAVHVCRIDTCLLESGIYCLLNLLILGLLNSYCALAVDNLLRAIFS